MKHLLLSILVSVLGFLLGTWLAPLAVEALVRILEPDYIRTK